MIEMAINRHRMARTPPTSNTFACVRAVACSIFKMPSSLRARSRTPDLYVSCVECTRTTVCTRWYRNTSVA
jgi:hypothetical protein